jgi:hypothetical protein
VEMDDVAVVARLGGHQELLRPHGGRTLPTVSKV